MTTGCSRPRLVNLAENPQLSEMLSYELRDGVSRVGRWREDSSDNEIQLRGPLIADDHWFVARHLSIFAPSIHALPLCLRTTALTVIG